MGENIDEKTLRESVAAEVRRFFAHMKEVRPAYDGRTLDELIDDSLDWYLGIPLVGSCPSVLNDEKGRLKCPGREGHKGQHRAWFSGRWHTWDDPMSDTTDPRGT